MAKYDNLKDFLKDVADAIREKKGSSDLINPQDFSAEIASIQSGGGSKWTGHADAEGLRAIGWTDDDIAYYQENGVNWNEEDDDYHKVTDDNKALYGVLTASNISTYKDRLVYLPKIDTSAKTNGSEMFSNCKVLVAIPSLDTRNMTNMYRMFYNCMALVCICPLDTSSVTNFSGVCYYCYSLVTMPNFNFLLAQNTSYAFASCYALRSVPSVMELPEVVNLTYMFSKCCSLTFGPQIIAPKANSLSYLFNSCYSMVGFPSITCSETVSLQTTFTRCYKLATIPKIEVALSSLYETFDYCNGLTNITYLDVENTINLNGFNDCQSLSNINLKNLGKSISFKYSPLLSKESLLYIINNEIAAAAITITLAATAYTRLAEDADIVAALANHPNISLASA